MSIRLLHISDEQGPPEKYEDDSHNINYLSTINPVHHPNSETRPSERSNSIPLARGFIGKNRKVARDKFV